MAAEVLLFKLVLSVAMTKGVEPTMTQLGRGMSLELCEKMGKQTVHNILNNPYLTEEKSPGIGQFFDAKDANVSYQCLPLTNDDEEALRERRQQTSQGAYNNA